MVKSNEKKKKWRKQLKMITISNNNDDDDDDDDEWMNDWMIMTSINMNEMKWCVYDHHHHKNTNTHIDWHVIRSIESDHDQTNNKWKKKLICKISSLENGMVW